MGSPAILARSRSLTTKLRRLFTDERMAGVEEERIFKEGYHVLCSCRESGLPLGKNQFRLDFLTADFVHIQGIFMLMLYADSSKEGSSRAIMLRG